MKVLSDDMIELLRISLEVGVSEDDLLQLIVDKSKRHCDGCLQNDRSMEVAMCAARMRHLATTVGTLTRKTKIAKVAADLKQIAHGCERCVHHTSSPKVVDFPAI